jgi:hypothetical protein
VTTVYFEYENIPRITNSSDLHSSATVGHLGREAVEGADMADADLIANRQVKAIGQLFVTRIGRLTCSQMKEGLGMQIGPSS